MVFFCHDDCDGQLDRKGGRTYVGMVFTRNVRHSIIDNCKIGKDIQLIVDCPCLFDL